MNSFSMTQLRRRLLVTIGLLALFGVGAVTAGDSMTSKTKLKFKDGDTVETISFEGKLAVGQSIGLYSEAGTPVTVTRNEDGLKVEFPNKTHEIPYADPSELGADGEHRNVVVIKREGGAAGDVDVDTEVDIASLSDDPAIQAEIEAAIAEAGGTDGTKKIIIKHIDRKETTSDSSSTQH